MHILEIEDGLYGFTRMLGIPVLLDGPFHDIDDLLDCCFECMAEFDCDASEVFYVEVKDGQCDWREFPRGALPNAEGTEYEE